ncbi:C-type lectin domain family 17, member A-like [Paramisgurnus dabryanus]|uniref:C-type lectin domain family 17, member A-like n=1 Tax=Paramisgurnus dabryanus TaxID=90735 RepID=UPI0031F46984
MGDIQISTVHIYAEPDPIRVRDPVKMKSYRTATMCLVLLCVLLLTAVIVLCVMFTQERDRLMKNLNTADGWIYFQSSLYFISPEKKSWTESRSYCRERGADLISINNKEEQDFVNKTCKEIVWIGLTDIEEEGKWKWVDGSTLTIRFWWPGEPNNYKDVEDCALSYKQGWNDVPCTDAFQSICEKNIFK